MTSDKEKIDEIIDLVEKTVSFVDEHEGKVKKILGEDDNLSLEQDDLLSELIRNEDSVRIIAETKDEYDEITVQKDGNYVVIGLGDESMRAEVPDDAKIEDVSATLNNKVLEVEIPRE